MEQVLYSLPDGWEWQSIEEVAQIGADRGFVPTPDSEGNVPFIGMTDIDQETGQKSTYELRNFDDVKKGYTKFQRDAVLFAKITPCTENNKTALIDNVDGGFATTEVFPIHALDSVEPKYLLHFFRSPSVRRFLIDNMEGATGRQRVPLKALKSVSVPVCGLKEQKRIVEKLDALLTRIDTSVEHLQESVTLADALSQNGLDIYFAELTKTNPELPLSKLADFISGYAFKSGDFTSESGVKPIKITNVGVNEFSENAEEFLPVNYESEYQRFAAKANDIVIALTRPIINGGLKVCRVPESYSGALVNQRVAAITSKNKHVLDFIYLYLQSSRTKNYVLEKSKSLNQPNLSITDLKNLALPLPANDEAIAKAVADCNALISKARKSKAEISEKITMMQQLKASILDSAFKGEL
ncbi:restriction endonuclease subunit S [Aeromonas sp. QDB14]|uniref:restriction endonuclease subunit S n=1 Tax=Aeromonas sp. QDB14 TaxID=2989836 RepID=UPI0022DE9D00|nr:restriction endonuclease subunit S [Aeromonas sp. QDB14]